MPDYYVEVLGNIFFTLVPSEHQLHALKIGLN